MTASLSSTRILLLALCAFLNAQAVSAFISPGRLHGIHTTVIPAAECLKRRKPPSKTAESRRTVTDFGLYPKKKHHYHEGDDMRWHKRFWRRLRNRSMLPRQGLNRNTPVRTSLIVSNIIVYLYQVINTTSFIRRRYPSRWSRQALSIVADSLIGASVLGPLTKDFFVVPAKIVMDHQPHRYLTSGFLHGGIFHLLVNMDTLRGTPDWLETGLGWPLFLCTYLVSIVTGNLAFLQSAVDDDTGCLGASGGVCGLYGLMFVALVKMGNRKTSLRVLRGMGTLFLVGAFLEDISNAGHVGGFLGGVAMAILYLPSYYDSYAMRRKNSLAVDTAPKDYRAVMGYGVEPSKQGILPLWTLSIPLLLAMAAKPRIAEIPIQVWNGLVRPGSLSGLLL